MNCSRSEDPCEGCENRKAGRCRPARNFLTPEETSTPEASLRMLALQRDRQAAHS